MANFRQIWSHWKEGKKKKSASSYLLNIIFVFVDFISSSSSLYFIARNVYLEDFRALFGRKIKLYFIETEIVFLPKIRDYLLWGKTLKDTQCDQIAGLLVIFKPFAALKNCPNAYKICQNKFKMFPNTKWTLSKWPKFLNGVPTWRNFAKSGHTEDTQWRFVIFANAKAETFLRSDVA